ncbi:unnamed protein product [Brassicogethes aeneus]|uniref:Protein SZT2 n=1 Tax=Brassicogethes aeneus TaxID=1431903 RepID=A0A9P0BFE0_BRAAE|nr:unnamed protein product [Brassicogethes aeneus]
MEFDSLSVCSDEGVELTISEHGALYPGDYPYKEENEPPFLEAKTVYILLPKNVSISRAKRLQWLLDHLNIVISIPSLQKVTETIELEVISAVPREQTLVKCNRFLITTDTELKFVAHSYRFVYCLDMSPSQSNVDIQRGEVLFDEILVCFKSSLEALTRQFTIPGNSLVFQPAIHLTVMVNTPFFMSPAQQVLVKGVQISSSNLNYIISYIEKQFHLLEGKIADVSVVAHEQLDIQRTQNEGMVGQLFDLPDSEKFVLKIPMVTADANFVNMLRYSMLAITLLPDISISHILVITDGIVAMPDFNIMESLLYQLHYDSIAVSFLKVGSSFHPHSSAGYVPYVDLLYFLSHSTLGNCFETFPDVIHEPSMSLNVYQELFLLWSFHSKTKNIYPKISGGHKWTSTNESFYSHKPPSLLFKKQTEEKMNTSILLMLARRLREGFTVDKIYLANGDLEVRLSLQWKSFIYMNYKITSDWPITKHNVKFEINILAPYEFLHDITCMIKKESKSVNRLAIIKRFWLRLSQLSTEDVNMAQNLSSFQSCNKDWFVLPESVRSGIPVFTANGTACSAEATKLSLHLRDVSSAKFVHVWQTLASMETNVWRKWLHIHKISLILKHDNPLPKHLHLPNSSQRYQVIQCRQATAALYKMLADWSSFILIDNHTYVKFLHADNDKPACGFCLIRITSKFPCAVLNIGFITGTNGEARQRVCDELKSELSGLSYLTTVKLKENICCVLLQKPIEKILIRYERIPSSFTTVIFPDGTQPPNSTVVPPAPVSGSLFTTLSRYLYHKRWIWGAYHPANPKLPDTAISRILSTLTGMRIKEGFSFAHSSSGIITMVLELWMDQTSSCVVQYVLFPPHCAWCGGDDFYSGSDEENDMSSELDSEMQLVTEVWIEPQYGKVLPSDPRISYMDNKHYYEIADVICRIDLQCINSLLTMEHLSLMCQDKGYPMLTFNRMVSSTSRKSRKSSRNSYLEPPIVPDNGSQCYPIVSQRIEHIPFKFDPINILPHCQQTELLFSMFIEGKESSLGSSANKANVLLLNNILDHLNILHDQELDLSKAESDRFTQQILLRHQNQHPNNCPISEFHSRSNFDVPVESQWRCFLKGISVTHVILTFIPSTLDDLKSLVCHETRNIPNLNVEVESERASSRTSNFSDVPINVQSSLCLPIYVFDCPLAMLVKAYMNNADDKTPTNEDIYEDHRFKTSGFIQEEYVKLKSDDSTDGDKADEYDIESRNVRSHCKALVLAHSKCFTISLFVALHGGVYVHSTDVQSAMDQCEEFIREIDITDYILTICGHVKHQKDETIPIKPLHQPMPCNDLSSLHSLIKEKFLKIVGVAFNPIPTNEEFYYYQNLVSNKVEDNNVDSDDEISTNLSELVEFKSEKDYSSFYSEDQPSMDVGDENTEEAVSPLFLHLICTLKYNNGGVSNTSVRVIPTCLGELIQHLDDGVECLDRSKIRVTLDILCLTLPSEVQNIIENYSTSGLRTTSFCSDVFQPSVDSSISEASDSSDIPVVNLSEAQKNTVISLKEEIKWLLKDEIATALLDIEPVKPDTLNFVTSHVTTGSQMRASCVMDIIKLNFVYACRQSSEKFVEEFSKIKLPDCKLCKIEDFYYLAKDNNGARERRESGCFVQNDFECSSLNDSFHLPDMFNTSKEDADNKSVEENASQISDISTSINGSMLGTEGGYDEDDSEDYDISDLLQRLNKKRKHLHNFWLIMKIEQELVTIYFHCRFLEMQTLHVGEYLDKQRAISDAIKALCKKVNQLVLLQNLYESKTCDPLLEPDDSCSETCNSPISRNPSYVRLKSMEESVDDLEIMACSASLSEASLNFKPGYFSCPVVWETRFVLHPRLKTGPGKSGISRGILALRHILEKFSVSNRNNMFVYRDNKNNVFYLRLHENVQYPNKNTSRSNEYDNGPVSRSPSMASLPLAQNKSNLTQSEQSINSIISMEIRPRVRSFGEKESKDGPNEDTLILKVHGITEAGDDVQFELVQVLQNKLDNAVLEFLSIMLARNAMCPLTPEDVQFIQKPFRPPEEIIRFTIQEYISNQYLDPFVYYLKQNLLQFLNNPKYTDNRSHFKDYSEHDSNKNRDDSIFIYNQSQNPSSGNRGIACIALAVISNITVSKNIDIEDKFKDNFSKKIYEPLVTTSRLNVNDKVPNSYIEFRLWKQGRVNIDNLSLKLNEAVSQATWDIVTEYYLLKNPLCEMPNEHIIVKNQPIDIDTAGFDLTKEIEFVCVLDSNMDAYHSNNKLENSKSEKRKIDKPYLPRKRSKKMSHEKENNNEKLVNEIEMSFLETGDKGVLSNIYSSFLPSWLEFGFSLNVPSVKRLQFNLSSRHLPNVTIKEIINMLQDSPKAFCATPRNNLNGKEEIYAPVLFNNYVQKYVIVSRNFNQWTASLNTEKIGDFPEVLRPQSLKHTQKFVPDVINNILIPRQKILWLLVESDSIVIFTYNWARDNVEKLNSNCNNLTLWLSVRSCFLNSITSQKLGLFHNQPLTRKCFMMVGNPYAAYISDMDYMSKYPRDHKKKRIPSTYNLHIIVEAFRDSFRISKFASNDPVVMLTSEMCEMKAIEKRQREEMKKLHNMYQSRTSTTTVSQIFLLMQNSRIIHYCHTPLLFLPRWRLKSAATRDHSLYPSQAIQIADKLSDEDKESWHTELCYAFFTDYRQYLQTLGFMPLQIDSPHKNTGLWIKDKSSYNSVFFIQKTILGGILLFTVEISEPFFITKLHVIECNRLQNISSRASINRFTLSFLDECDRVKILMHLHSFAYDYHLRCIYNYISAASAPNRLSNLYNVHQFLDDFMKYYNKTPNFARNLVYADTLTIKNLVTEGKQLYDYLLSNIAQYNFKVFEMEANEDMECILVQVTSTPQVSYKDSQDRHHTDDFDITLVIYNLCTPYSPKDNVLHLKYYLILTSKREIYPKSEVEHKLGKFRTVSSTARSLSALERNDLEESTTKTIESSEIDCDSSDEDKMLTSENDSNNRIESSISQQSMVPYVEISQESVNYLGYYSSHEQLMHQLILDKANTTQKHVKDMVAKGMVHCRTFLLWNRLISPHDTHSLNYEEFIELKNLAKLDHLCDLHPNLGPLLNQPLVWYQGLAKLLLVKYNEQHRTFISADGNIQHYVILHPNYFGAFMLLSIDLHTFRGELYAVYREPHKQEDAELCLAYQKNLLDGFVNCISFYLWSGMISN